MNSVLHAVMYFTSWVMRQSIKMKWWRIVKHVSEFRKNTLFSEMRKRAKNKSL